MEAEYLLAVALNNTVIYLLLEGSARISGNSVNRWRMVMASIVNGIYCLVCLFYRNELTDYFINRILCVCLVCLIAFGMKKNSWINSCIFFVLYMSHDGIVHLIPGTESGVSLVYAVAISALCGLAKKYGTSRKKYAKLELSYSGRRIYLDALYDTGNNLRDPVSGEGIIVIGPEASTALTGLSRSELESPLETMLRSNNHHLRLIPYSSVGNSDGMMLGLRINKAKLNGVSGRILIGMAAEGLGGYEALIGGNHDY